jgi:serine/threonine-protein kinase
MDGQVESLRAALTGRYAVIREIGSGGMATVYLAEDIRHKRQVAVKVLRAELAAQAGAERFLREITIAASLSHPNILPVHDSGEAGGFLYYVMPFVEGESLRDRLRRERQLPIPDAIRIVKEVTAALSYAHAHGVVLRDIKAENVIFFGGQAVVSDFGFARAVMGPTESALTSTGIVIGTPTYMSPEQATGDREIDPRSDLYSLACVLYEMLAGDPPFTGGSPNSITARKLTDPVPRLATVRETVTPGLERTIATALARSPADRFPSVEAFTTALEGAGPGSGARRWKANRRVLRGGTIAAMALGGLVIGGLGIRRLLGSRPPRFARVAVLPVRVAGPDSVPGYLADGLTEGLIGDLARLERIDVIALASVDGYRTAPKPIDQVAKELGAGAVIEGTVRQTNARLILEVRLSVPGQDAPQWTQSFEAGRQEARSLETEAFRGLTRYLGVASTRPDRAAEVDPKVHDLYLRGRYHLSGRSPEGFQNAVDYFRQALAIDPAHAPSYAGLAQYYSLLPWYTKATPAESFERALSAARKAVELDPNLPEAHSALAYLKAFRDWDWDGAKLEYARALALKPADADLHHLLSRLLAIRGEMDEAVREAERSHELDPLSLIAHANIGVIRYFGRDYADAERRLKATLELSPDFSTAHWGLGMVYEQLGRFKEAEAEFNLAGAQGRRENLTASFGHLFGVTGRRAEAEATLKDLTGRFGDSPTLLYQLAVVEVGLGRPDDALTHLEQAVQKHETLMSYSARDPRLDPLRGSPRFAAVLQRMNLRADSTR